MDGKICNYSYVKCQYYYFIYISDITGCNVEIILSCMDENIYESKNLSEYINIKQRNINTFYDFNI